MKKGVSELTQLRKKQSTTFQTKMIHVVYQLSNSFGFNKDFGPLFSEKESEQTEEISDKMQKPLWFKINKAEFDELTGYIYNNQDNNDFKITIKKIPYNLKKAKEFWTKVTTRKITEGDAKS